MSFHIKQQENEEGTIVLLHGYGADAENLQFLVNEWRPHFKTWNFIGLDGPMKLPTGYAWFDLSDEKWMQGIIIAAQELEQHFKNYKKPLVFAGFSQGAFLAAQLGTYSNLNIKGSICFSGGLIPLNKPAKNTPLYFVHGSSDDIILPSWFEETMRFGKEKQLNIEGIMIDQMAHDINQTALAHATIFLSKLINKKIAMQ